MNQQHAAGIAQTGQNTAQIRLFNQQALLAIGHVTFDRGRSGSNDLRNLGQRGCGGLGDDRMDAPIDQRLALRFREFGVNRAHQGCARFLVGEIDDGGGAAKSCGKSACVVVVDADGVHEDVVEMDVGVNAAGQDKQTIGIDCFIGRQAGQIADGSDLFAANEQVALRGGVS